VDLIIGGRQAIDGDTAQVGPQVAEKLGLNQITYTEEILSLEDGKITVKRHIDGGVETVESSLPCVLTVNGSAAPCRPRNVKRVMKFKRCLAPMELPQGTDYADLPYASEYEKKPYLKIGQLTCADINADLQQCGLAGSPTKVKNVENIVFKAKESKVLTGSDEDINALVQELLASHTIG
jgi:electron transfer flavoprotein beta subunit